MWNKTKDTEFLLKTLFKWKMYLPPTPITPVLEDQVCSYLHAFGHLGSWSYLLLNFFVKLEYKM